MLSSQHTSRTAILKSFFEIAGPANNPPNNPFLNPGRDLINQVGHDLFLWTTKPGILSKGNDFHPEAAG